MINIQEYFTSGYDYIIVPKLAVDVPITMKLMLVEATEDTEEFYHTINTLSTALGSLFTPTPIIDERFIVIHFGFDKDNSEADFREFLELNGMVAMRGVVDSVDSIDFASLADNAYGVFSAREIKYVPKHNPIEEV